VKDKGNNCHNRIFPEEAILEGNNAVKFLFLGRRGGPVLFSYGCCRAKGLFLLSGNHKQLYHSIDNPDNKNKGSDPHERAPRQFIHRMASLKGICCTKKAGRVPALKTF
jgi:hypothetical protein